MFVWDSHATAGNGADVAEAGAASDMFGASVEWRASDAAVFGTDDHASHASGSSGASTVESLGYVVENDLLHSHVFARLQELSAASKTRAATATAAATGTTAAAAEDGAAPVPVMNPVWLSYYANTGTVEALSSTGVSAIALPPAATVVPTASAPAPAAEAAEAAAASAGPEGSGVTSRFARLSLADGRTVAARLVIGADGQSSLVKSAAGLDAVGWDYPHRASVATVQLDRPLTTAYQRFLPSGPVALLPLYGPLANVVWSSGHAHAKHLIACAEEEYLRQLTAALFTPAADLAPLAQRSGIRVEGPLNAWGLPELSPASLLKHVASLPDKVASFWRNPLPPSLRSAAKHLRSPPSLLNLPSNGATAGDAEPTCEMPPRPVAVRGPRAGFPLKLSLGIEYVNPRVAIIGDAAHVTHPLAGQGVNLGFGDVAALTKELVAGVGAGADIGDYHVLKNYQAKQVRSFFIDLVISSPVLAVCFSRLLIVMLAFRVASR
jgi:ubiquinone biosynthesis UbiH/UbiF/VisC/COQ6 family hydroxylase